MMVEHEVKLDRNELEYARMDEWVYVERKEEKYRAQTWPSRLEGHVSENY